jgi:hypothetical protein
MSTDGRGEVRVALTMAVCLVSTTDPDAGELLYTENVSSSGVRAVSKRRWQPGEHHRIVPMSGNFHLPVRIVYCQRITKTSFGVGLELHGSSASWWEKL